MHEKIRNNINEISLCIVMNNGELIEKIRKERARNFELALFLHIKLLKHAIKLRIFEIIALL